MHQDEPETEKKRSYQCEYCDETFHTKKAFNIHLRTHSAEKPFKCDQCDFAVTKEYLLVKHKHQTHSAARKYTFKKRKLPTDPLSDDSVTIISSEIEPIKQEGEF